MYGLIQSVNGYWFPCHKGEILSWSIQLTDHDRQEGYPRAKAVIAAMRIHRPDQLERERREMLKASFCRMFGHNAKTALNLIEGRI